ncbi:MAG: radical SAM protein [Planctomycetia bacterium]|nr:radical SAM protein [Planctomycetia bacterium]
MKILLIAPASGMWRHVGRHRFLNGRTFRFSLLSLLSVAAESPSDAEVRIVDEQIDDIPWDADVDLVGITCMTAAAPRAYEIARRFRRRLIPVVLGGMHPTLCPAEAIRHADAIVVGEAEGIWRKVVEDACEGRLKGVYRNERPPLGGLKRPRRDLLPAGKHAGISAVQATRGCPHGCDFCAVAAFNGHTQRQRPVEEVIAEIKDLPSCGLIFVDDNLTADRDYAKRLFAALRPLGKRWVTQSTLAIADDPDLVRMMADAGCVGIFAGLETFSEDNLGSVNKTCHRVEQYREAIQLFHRHGITVEAGIVFGFDGDGPDVFRRTLKTLDDLEVDLIQVSIFTPLPGTPRAKLLADRVFDRDWANYDFHHAVFQPGGMSPRDLQAGHDWVTHQFYRPSRILRRIWRRLRRPRAWASLPFLAAVNAAYLGRTIRWRIRGWDPAGETPADDNSPARGATQRTLPAGRTCEETPSKAGTQAA